MRNNKRYITLLALGLTLLLAGLAACEPSPSPTPTPTPSPGPPRKATATPELSVSTIRQACQAQSERGREKQSRRPGNLEVPPYQDLLYLEGHVIVTGPENDIDEAIRALGLELEQLEDDIDVGEQVKIRLYEITDGKSVEEISCELNELRKAHPQLAVSADPNYHISPGSEWSGGGSPWTQNGDWVEGVPGGGLSEAQSAEFLSQWTLEAEGIPLSSGGGGRIVEHTGRDTRIAIFDTSPFTRVDEGEECVDCFSFRALMGEVDERIFAEEVSLTVWHPKLMPAPNCPGLDRHTGASREGQDISNHGLFVAGLAHVVAPASEIHLVRVLEDDGCGALHTIVTSIEAFVAQTLEETGTLAGTVINLSLGVHEPPNPSQFGLPEEVTSLKKILKWAVDKGAVVVAAAGNDSYSVPPGELPKLMEIPAGYPFVIGVAASNIHGRRGCFSNMGDVAAPGGDGDRPSCTEKGCNPSCTIPRCTSDDPDGCLISLAPRSSTGYAFWVGTSFATPLVSGQAALLLEAGVPPADVASEITGSACASADPTLATGIINLPHSLLGAPCPP